MFYEFAEKVIALEKSGKKIVKLHGGNTNLPAPRQAVEAALKEIKQNRSGYGSSAGLTELRELIAQREKCGVENVVVGPGSKHLLFALLSMYGHGGRVVFPSPHWPAYELACKTLGLKQLHVPTLLEKKWQLEELRLQKNDLFVLCNPQNPTSTIFEQKTVNAAIELAREKKALFVIDEAYKGLAFEKIPVFECVRVRSFSKEFSLEGWRIGYTVAPKEIIKKIISFNQVTCTCVPEFVQRAAMACIENEKEIISRHKKIWQSRAEIAAIALKKAGFSFAQPQAGIYCFATHPKITDSQKFAFGLLQEGVAVSFGSEFGGYNKFLRVCLNQGGEVLKEAIGKMAQIR